MSLPGRKLKPRVISTVPGSRAGTKYGNPGFVEVGSTKQADRPRELGTQVDRRAVDFSVALHRAIHAKQNLVHSPACILDSLRLLLLGAQGSTKAELLRWIDETLDDEANGPSFGVSDRYQVSTAAGLFSDTAFHLEPSYLASFAKLGEADATSLPLRDDPGGSIEKINQWVANKTQGKVTQLAASSDLDSRTSLILAVAVYFKGKWATPFNQNQTRLAQFHNAAGAPVEVPMMHSNSEHLIAHLPALGATAVKLPYERNFLSMIIVVPNELDGLPAVEDSLTHEMLSLSEFQSTRISFALPKFKIESRESLMLPLRQLGLAQTFSDSANFGGMSATAPLSVSGVSHCATIEVDEEGTEASAATMLVMRIRSMPRRIHADRPFLFVIQENESKRIWFMGRVNRL